MIKRADEALALAYEFAHRSSRADQIDFDGPVEVRYYEDGLEDFDPPYWEIWFSDREPYLPGGAPVIVSEGGKVQWDSRHRQ